MTRTTLHRVAIAAAGMTAFAAACGPPPAPPPVYHSQAAPGSDSLVVPVVSVTTALADGENRWVVLAPVEGRVLIADFGSDSVRAYPGITKAAVPNASALIGLGDTVLVADWGLRRVTAWTEAGKQIAAWPMPDGLHGALPRARDAAGQWYFQIDPEPKDDGSGLLDSAAVVRADPPLTRFDTLARLAPPDLAITQGMNGNRYQRRALSGSDIWGVEPDGTLWVARVYQNVVEWYPRSGGKPVRTRPLPDPVLPVTQMDRQLFLQRYPEDQRPIAARLPFAAVKAPFEQVFAGPNGRMWLFKSDTALAPVRSFQVVDSTGVRFYVDMPSRGSAVGLSGNHVLMAEQFPGGVRLLQYVVPPEAGR